MKDSAYTIFGVAMFASLCSAFSWWLSITDGFYGWLQATMIGRLFGL